MAAVVPQAPVAALNRAGAITSLASNILNERIDIEISTLSVALITALGFVYMVVAALGIDIFSKSDKFKDSTMHENFNKYLAATLTIGLTMPATLILLKMVKSDGAAFSIVYAIMGIIGSAIVLNWTTNDTEKRESAQIFSGLTLASFICTLLIAVLLISVGSRN